MNADERIRRAEIAVAILSACAAAGAIAFAVIYVFGAQTQLAGVALAIAFVSLAAALVTWEHELMRHRDDVEETPPLPSSAADRASENATLRDGIGAIVGRRRWLVGTVATAASAVVTALLFPLRSLAPNFGSSLAHTVWFAGARLVREDGTPVRANDLDVDSVVTVFPEGFTGPEHADVMANAATMLVRVPPAELELPADRARWAPAGLVAYSKVCTHAGCPVALYRARDRQLICPCHQSTFDVLRGGARVFGPADRGLPQLPIEIAGDGTLRATSDYREPVGPDYWERA